MYHILQAGGVLSRLYMLEKSVRVRAVLEFHETSLWGGNGSRIGP